MNTVTSKYNRRLGWVLSNVAAPYTGIISEELPVRIDRAIPRVATIATESARQTTGDYGEIGHWRDTLPSCRIGYSVPPPKGAGPRRDQRAATFKKSGQRQSP